VTQLFSHDYARSGLHLLSGRTSQFPGVPRPTPAGAAEDPATLAAIASVGYEIEIDSLDGPGE